VKNISRKITLIIIACLCAALPALAATYYADNPAYVYTSTPDATVVQSDTLWGSTPDHSVELTSTEVDWLVQDGDQVSINWYDVNGDVISVTDLNMSDATPVTAAAPSGTYSAKLVLNTGSAAGERWAWWHSATNANGDTTIFPDPDTGGGGGGDGDVDLTPVVDELQVIQGQLDDIKGQLDTTPVVDELQAIKGKLDTIISDTGEINTKAGEIKNELVQLNVTADETNTGVQNTYSYLSTPRQADAIDTSALGDVPAIDPTPPPVEEPYQEPYQYNRNTIPEMPPTIDSPGPLPIAPDPVVMEHDEPAQVDPPAELDEPLQPDPVNMDEPISPDPVSMDPPVTPDPVNMDPPVTPDPPIQRDEPIEWDEPIARDEPITPDPPIEPDPPMGG